MTGESKPRKKKLNLSEVLSNPAKVIGDLLEDPEVADKLALAVSKLPPAAMDILAQKVAERMPKPPTAEEIAAALEVTAIPPESPTPGNNGDIEALKSQMSDLVMDSFSKLQAQIMQVMGLVKTMQDEQPVQIQNNVASIFQQELKIFEEKTAASKQELLAYAGNGNGGNRTPAALAPSSIDRPTAPRGQGLALGLSLDQILTIITTAADAWSKFKPPVTAALAEDKLRAYTLGFTSGNKMRGGVVGSDDVAKEMLQIAATQPPPK
ncbi:MAG: hypothetical protein Q8O55_03670 [Dehalococcoidales bacterium]|nr:hypothetical protein [Dehalococcoidales bacterium]